MFPTRLSRIFRSRWAALLWAAGILWFAVDTVGFGDNASHAKAGDAQNGTAVTDVTGADVSDADLAVLKNVIEAGSK